MRWGNPKSLENSALYYLERFAATTESLRRVMMRKLRRAAAEEWDVKQARAMIDELIPKLEALGYLNDQKFAETRAASLRARGSSQRAITAKLRAKGIKDVPKATEDEELAAAMTYAKRRRLGEHRAEPATREERQKDLAAMGRAGFSFAVSKRALGG